MVVHSLYLISFCALISSRYTDWNYFLHSLVNTYHYKKLTRQIQQQQTIYNKTIQIKQTGLSPLSNKPAFLLTYAGFTVALNVIRPARFALSVAISPYFERINKYFQRKFGVSAKAATVLVVVFVNLIGTCSLMGLGVGLASVLSGVPVWAGK